MSPSNPKPNCAVHGHALKRATCNECNASYMRFYLRARRSRTPQAALYERAMGRARRTKDRFTLRRQDIFVPRRCPALGLPLRTSGRRSDCSPSLDKIDPALGYVRENVRVISDRANRLKGARDVSAVKERATTGSPEFRADYKLIGAYLDREAVLKSVRDRVKAGGSTVADWVNIARFLDVNFREGDRVFRTQFSKRSSAAA